MSEIPVSMFLEIMERNGMDPMVHVARVLCRQDGVDPDEMVSVKRALDAKHPPMMRGWMWYAEEAQKMLGRDDPVEWDWHKTGTPPA